MGLEVIEKKSVMVMSLEQKAGQNHNIKISDKCQCGRVYIIGNNLNESKLPSLRRWKQTELWECLLSFGPESFVFLFAFIKPKD